MGSERAREHRALLMGWRRGPTCGRQENLSSWGCRFPCWSMTETPLWPHGLLEPRAMGSPPRQRWRSWCALSHAAEHRGRDLTENPQRQPESCSSCCGATFLARSNQAARQADTWCTVYGVDSTTAQMIGVLGSPSEGCPKGCPLVLPRFQRGPARSPFRHMVHRV